MAKGKLLAQRIWSASKEQRLRERVLLVMSRCLERAQAILVSSCSTSNRKVVDGYLRSIGQGASEIRGSMTASKLCLDMELLNSQMRNQESVDIPDQRVLSASMKSTYQSWLLEIMWIEDV